MENSTETKPFNWTTMFPTVTCPDGTKDIANGIAPPCMGKYGNNKPNETSEPVVCKDGTKKMQPSSPNAKYMDVCMNNGGVAENKTVVNAPVKYVKSQDKEENFWESLGLKQSDMISAKVKGRFYLVVVLVAGYFAYKKFKK